MSNSTINLIMFILCLLVCVAAWFSCDEFATSNPEYFDIHKQSTEQVVNQDDYSDVYWYTTSGLW